MIFPPLNERIYPPFSLRFNSSAKGSMPAVGRPDASTTVCPCSCISISAFFVSGVIFFSEFVNVPSRSSTNTFLSIFQFLFVSFKIFVRFIGQFYFQNPLSNLSDSSSPCTNSLRKLTVVKICIESVLCQQTFMAALLNNISILHDKNDIGIFDRR